MIRISPNTKPDITMKNILFICCLSTVALAKYIPNKPITEDINFFYYSKENANDSIELKVDQILPESVNRNNPWKFFVHGFTTSPKVSPWFHSGKDAYFKRGEYNIVFVDWSKPANLSYLASCLASIGSGKYLAKFIMSLVKQDVSLDNVHLLGHSLGTHMVGFAGKQIIKESGMKIGRITGLDPAGPLFETGNIIASIMPYLLPENSRISKEDAKFVDIIHTDGGFYGMKTSVGDIDIFPNGGVKKQPGCDDIEDVNCSHARSTHLYVESINSKQLIATQCQSYDEFQNGYCKNNIKTVLGEDCDQSLRGDFYLETNAQPPYGKGK